MNPLLLFILSVSILGAVFAGQLSPLPTLPSHRHLILLSDLTWGLNLKAISPRKNWLAVVVRLSCSQTRWGGAFLKFFFFFSVGFWQAGGPGRRVVNMVVIPGGEGLC